MVQNPVKTPPTSRGAIQPLNSPKPVLVEEKEGLPCRIRLTSKNAGNSKFQIPNSKQYRNSRFLEIAAIEDSWRVDEEWWREKPVSRLYFEVLLADGRRLTVFKEMLEGKWYQQKS